MIGFSVTEVEMVLAKAARGNGAGVADAQRFAKAGAMCLCAGDGADLINEALVELPVGLIVEYATRIQKRLSDTAEDSVIFPSGDPLWVGYIRSLPYKSEEGPKGEYTVSLGAFGKLSRPARLYIPDDTMTYWQALAAKTYVPETEQSRNAGAGAGLTDND